VKLLDFGIAKVERREGRSLTEPGVTMGTPEYMSPEQIVGRGIDARSDIYSIGVVLYLMLSGRLPFDGPTVGALLVQHANEPPPPLEELELEHTIPDALKQVVMKCLEKKASNRFQSAAELDRALVNAMATVPTSPVDTEGLPSSSSGSSLDPGAEDAAGSRALEATFSGVSRRKQRWVALGLALLVAGTVSSYFLMRAPAGALVNGSVGSLNPTVAVDAGTATAVNLAPDAGVRSAEPGDQASNIGYRRAPRGRRRPAPQSRGQSPAHTDPNSRFVSNGGAPSAHAATEASAKGGLSPARQDRPPSSASSSPAPRKPGGERLEATLDPYRDSPKPKRKQAAPPAKKPMTLDPYQ
jgi:serine/threonine protein kinase